LRAFRFIQLSRPKHLPSLGTEIRDQLTAI